MMEIGHKKRKHTSAATAPIAIGLRCVFFRDVIEEGKNLPSVTATT